MYINEKVPIEDVFPLKDEHGNDFARRDYSQKANRDYVARLDGSPSTAYRVDARVLRAALDGRLATPRGCRVLADALRWLERRAGRSSR